MALPSNFGTTTNAIKGLDEIRLALKKIKATEVTKINRAATRAGAKEIEKEADKRLPPLHRGKKKLDVERSRKLSKNDLEVFRIGPKAEHWGLIFFEYGAKPHDITPKTKKALAIPFQGMRWGGSVVEYFTKRVKNPGVEATHFLSLAIETAQPQVFKAMGDRYWRRIRKALKK